MAPRVKTHLSVLAQKIPTLEPGAKGVGDREILETYLNSASKNTSETFFLMRQNLCWPVLSDQIPLCFSLLFSACRWHTHVELNMDRNFMAKTGHRDQTYRQSAPVVNVHHDATCREQTACVTRFLASNSRRGQRVLPAGN